MTTPTDPRAIEAGRKFVLLLKEHGNEIDPDEHADLIDIIAAEYAPLVEAANTLVGKFPDLPTLLQLDDDDASGKRTCVTIKRVTIADVRALRAALEGSTTDA